MTHYALAEIPVVESRRAAACQGKANLLARLSEDRAGLYRELWRSGAVIFRGFSIDSIDKFSAIAHTLVGSPMRYTGGDAPRQMMGDGIYNSSDLPGTRAISPHNEKAYSAVYPDLIMFNCLTAAIAGGATSLVDGRRLLRRLSRHTVELYTNNRVTYIQNLKNEAGPTKTWRQTFETEDPYKVTSILTKLGAEFHWNPNNDLFVAETVPAVISHPVTQERVFFSPSHRWHVSNAGREAWRTAVASGTEFGLYHACRFEDGTPLDVDALDEIREVIRRESITVMLEPGDVIVLDNVLMLHGRLPYEGNRLLLTAMGRMMATDRQFGRNPEHRPK